MRPDLSVVIIANNATLRIGEVIGAARRISEDIVLLDSGSEDNTVEIATELGARVFHQEWLGYSATKNIGNGLAMHDWILSLDADEVLSERLIESIEELTLEHQEVYLLDRSNYFCGKRIRFSNWSLDHVPRIFNRKTAQWKGDYVHEKLVLEPYTKTRLLKGKLLHYSYETYRQRKDKIANYARLSAQERFLKGRRTNWLWALFSTVSKFLITYLLHLGILDGWAGVQIAYTDALQTWRRNVVLISLQKGLTPDCCK